MIILEKSQVHTRGEIALLLTILSVIMIAVGTFLGIRLAYRQQQLMGGVTRTNTCDSIVASVGKINPVVISGADCANPAGKCTDAQYGLFDIDCKPDAGGYCTSVMVGSTAVSRSGLVRSIRWCDGEYWYTIQAGVCTADCGSSQAYTLGLGKYQILENDGTLAGWRKGEITTEEVSKALSDMYSAETVSSYSVCSVDNLNCLMKYSE